MIRQIENLVICCDWQRWNSWNGLEPLDQAVEVVAEVQIYSNFGFFDQNKPIRERKILCHFRHENERLKICPLLVYYREDFTLFIREVGLPIIAENFHQLPLNTDNYHLI